MNNKYKALRILIIENDPATIGMVKDFAGSDSNLPVTVCHAGTLEDAINILAAGNIDLVLLGLNLAGPGWAGALARIRLEFPLVPVILLAEEEYESRKHCIEQGAIDVIEKRLINHYLAWMLWHATGRAGDAVRLSGMPLNVMRLAASMPMGLIIVGDDGRTRFANPAACRLMGKDIKPGDIVDLPVNDMGYELIKVEHGGGKSGFLEVHSFTVPRDQKEARAYFLLEATAQKLAERALKRSESLFSQAREAVGIGAWTFDPSDRILLASPEVYNILGIDPHKPINVKIFLSCVHITDRGKVEQAFDDLLSGKQISIEFKVKRDDEICWVEAKADTVNIGGSDSVIAGVLIDITEKKAQQELLENKNKELAARSRILSAIFRSLDMGERLEVILREILSLLEVDMAGIYLQTKRGLELKAWLGSDRDAGGNGGGFPEIADASWLRESVFVVEESHEKGKIPGFAKELGMRTWGTVPLRMGRGKHEISTKGLLVFASKSRKKSSSFIAKTLDSLSEHLCVAIDHALLFAESQKRLARIEVLRAIDRAIIGRKDVSEIVSIVIESIPESLGAEAVALSLLDNGKKGLQVFSMRLPNGTVISEQAFDIAENLWDWLVNKKEPVVIPDIVADGRICCRLPQIMDHGIRAYLGVPLVSADCVIGILHILSTRPSVFDKEDVDFFETLAGQAAIAIESATLFFELKKAEEKFRRLAENAPDIIYHFHFDPEPGFDYISPTVKRLTGYTPEEIYSDPEFLYKAVFPEDRATLQVLMEGKVSFDTPVLMRWKTKNGDIIWTEHYRTPIYDENGDLISVEGIARDITPRIHAEKERETQQKLLDSIRRIQDAFISDTMTDAPFRQALKGLIEITQSSYGFVAEVLYTETGDLTIKPHAISGESWDENSRKIFEKASRGDFVFKNLENMLGAAVGTKKFVISNDPANDHRRGILPPGHPRLDSFLGIPITTDQGIVGLVCLANRPGGYTPQIVEFIEPVTRTLAHLITSRRALEERIRMATELRIKSDHLERLSAGIDEVVWWITLDKKPSCEVNRAFEMLYGRKIKEFVADPEILARAAHEEDRPEVETLVNNVIKHGFASARYRIVRPDGSIRWVHDRRWIIYGADSGQDRIPQRIQGVITDITDQVMAEQDRIGRIAAEKANRAKSAFVANMSHEIRTPLNAILGFAQLMLNDPDITPAQKRHLETINRAGEHLLSLINDVLDLARIESGSARLHTSVFDIYMLASDIDRMFRPGAQAKGLGFRVDTAPDLPANLVGDEAKIRQVLTNLVGNAIKFTSQGWVVVKIEAASSVNGKEGDLLLRLTVKDTGPGIETDELERIFLPFEQLPRSSQKGGTGLGLAISKKLAQIMGGRLEVKSRPGHGSAFMLEIPVQAPEVDAYARDRIKRKRLIGLAPGPRQVRALVVDDVADNRELLTSLLESAGISAKEADNGLAALEIVKKESFDIIFMDKRMPVMDGYEAIKEIRKVPWAKKTPIVVVTASTLVNGRELIAEPGADASIKKPYRLEDILWVTASLLGRELLYRHADDDGQETLPSAEAGRIPDVKKIPPDLCRRMKKSIEIGDTLGLRESIKSLRSVDVLLSEHLDALAKVYDYEALLSLLENGEKGG